MFQFNCESCIHNQVCQFKEKNNKIIEAIRRQEISLEPKTLIKVSELDSTLTINCIYKKYDWEE